MNNSYKTAMSRKDISAPLKYLYKNKKIFKTANIIDFGSGKGMDVKCLQKLGYNIVGYDPYWNKNNLYLNNKYNIVLCTYVLNVVNKQTREKIINTLKNLTKPQGKIYITVRRDIKKHTISNKGTHQYSVNLPFKVMKKTSLYCIYEIIL